MGILDHYLKDFESEREKRNRGKQRQKELDALPRCFYCETRPIKTGLSCCSFCASSRVSVKDFNLKIIDILKHGTPETEKGTAPHNKGTRRDRCQTKGKGNA
jgi:hypothetical protein